MSRVLVRSLPIDGQVAPPPPPNPNTIPYLFQASLSRGQKGEESLFERGEGYTETSRRLVYQFSKND